MFAALDLRRHWTYVGDMALGTAGRFLVTFGFLCFGCGGPATPAEEPPTAFESEPAPAPVAANETNAETSSEADEAAESKPKPQAAEPEFKERISVEEAIKAAQGTERMNLDQETLGKPLTDPALYAPCKLAPSQTFKLRVAIWYGKAVGIDVTTQPNNAKATECIATQVRGVTWKDKVRSLNIVEFTL